MTDTTPKPETGETEPKPVESQETTTAETPVEEWDKERAAKTIKAQREEVKALKAKAARLEQLEAEEARRKEGELSDLQKAQARAEKAEKEAAELRQAELRRKVADETGLPPALAPRLQGATEEELKADAEELLKTLPKETKPKAPPIGVTNPPGAETKVSDDDRRNFLYKGGPLKGL